MTQRSSCRLLLASSLGLTGCVAQRTYGPGWQLFSFVLLIFFMISFVMVGAQAELWRSFFKPNTKGDPGPDPKGAKWMVAGVLVFLLLLLGA